MSSSQGPASSTLVLAPTCLHPGQDRCLRGEGGGGGQPASLQKHHRHSIGPHRRRSPSQPQGFSDPPTPYVVLQFWFAVNVSMSLGSAAGVHGPGPEVRPLLPEGLQGPQLGTPPEGFRPLCRPTLGQQAALAPPVPAACLQVRAATSGDELGREVH